MSLDVYLYDWSRDGAIEPGRGERIFVREGGATREMTRAEWDEANPGREPVVLADDERDHAEVYQANITHNLGKMAAAAGLYEALWRPEEHGYVHARDLVEPLTTGLALLLSDRPRFEAFNPENGWGDYDGLVRFARDYLLACQVYGDAGVRVSR